MCDEGREEGEKGAEGVGRWTAELVNESHTQRDCLTTERAYLFTGGQSFPQKLFPQFVVVVALN